MKRYGSSALVLLVVGLMSGACRPDVEDDTSVIDSSYKPAENDVIYSMSGSQLDALGKGGRITMQTLQGIVNRDAPQIFLAIDSGDTHDSNWLDTLSRNYDVEVEANQDYFWYLWAFQSKLDGYILFQNTNRESANVAVSLAGILNAVAIDKLSQDSLKAVDQELGLAQLVDVSEWTEQDLLNSKYWADFADGMVMQESFSGPETAPRDFGVSKRMPFFWDDSRDDESLHFYQTVMDKLGSDAVVNGWGYADYDDYGPEQFVNQASGRGLSVIGTERANNLSVLAHFPAKKALSQSLAVELPVETAVHTIAFVMSDGEQLGATMGRMTNQSFGHFDQVNSYPVGWTVSPGLYDYAAPVASWMYENASVDDLFIAAASGAGLRYPSMWSKDSVWTEGAANGMAKMGLTIATVADTSAGFNADLLGPLLDEAQVEGVFFTSVQSDELQTREILWHGGEPIIPTRKLGFSDIKTIDEIDAWVLDLAKEGLVEDVTSDEGYTLVYVNLWTTRLADLEALENLLEKSKVGNFQVVRPDVLMGLVIENVPHEGSNPTETGDTGLTADTGTETTTSN